MRKNSLDFVVWRFGAEICLAFEKFDSTESERKV